MSGLKEFLAGEGDYYVYFDRDKSRLRISAKKVKGCIPYHHDRSVTFPNGERVPFDDVQLILDKSGDITWVNKKAPPNPE